MNKVTYRVPTKEQYGFIEVEIDNTSPERVTEEVIKEKFDNLYAAMNSNQKVSDTQFLTDLMDIVDHNLKIEGVGATEWFESLTTTQKLVYSKIRLLVNRAISKYKPEK